MEPVTVSAFALHCLGLPPEPQQCGEPKTRVDICSFLAELRGVPGSLTNSSPLLELTRWCGSTVHGKTGIQEDLDLETESRKCDSSVLDIIDLGYYEQ
ncbi:hypothetical protein AOLI_G00204990 [Acnodon oligacanthus]